MFYIKIYNTNKDGNIHKRSSTYQTVLFINI